MHLFLALKTYLFYYHLFFNSLFLFSYSLIFLMSKFLCLMSLESFSLALNGKWIIYYHISTAQFSNKSISHSLQLNKSFYSLLLLILLLPSKLIGLSFFFIFLSYTCNTIITFAYIIFNSANTKTHVIIIVSSCITITW